MKIERFAGHNEAREALVLSVASVTAIILTAYLLLLILYWLLGCSQITQDKKRLASGPASLRTLSAA
jgi:hypothetical protein